MTTVLVVEDSAVDRRLIGELLGRESRWTVEYAENGAEALTRMKSAAPDIVVTDLLMPEMDGLELVTAARVFHAEVPVILITGHGSEALALEALERGAASYVPKAHLVERLPEAIKEVLALARANRSHKRLIECLHRTEFGFALDTDPSLVEALVDLVQMMLVGVGLCDDAGRVRLGMALEQALLNALYHGNLELSQQQIQEARDRLREGEESPAVRERRSQSPYCDRKVFVDIRLSSHEAQIVVRDEGKGFDVSALPARDDPGVLEKEAGRGLVLMRTFMDEVTFNPAGNEVTMVKRRAAEGPPGDAGGSAS
jgi:CheY-like chemotaxis protein